MFVIVVAAIYGARALAPAVLEVGGEAKKFTLSWAPFVLFAIFFVGLPLLATQVLVGNSLIAIAADFFYAGSLVFGGGHVVLPLLQELLSERLATDTCVASKGKPTKKMANKTKGAQLSVNFLASPPTSSTAGANALAP